MFTNPREAYEKALSDFGHVVGVWRKGRVQFRAPFKATNPAHLKRFSSLNI